MGLFSSSSSRSTSITNTQNTGFSEIAGPAIAVQGEGNQVSMIDPGVFDFAGQVTERALQQVEIAGTQARGTVGEAVRAVSEANRAETENIMREAMKWGTIALVAFVAFQALPRILGK